MCANLQDQQAAESSEAAVEKLEYQQQELAKAAAEISTHLDRCLVWMVVEAHTGSVYHKVSEVQQAVAAFWHRQRFQGCMGAWGRSGEDCIYLIAASTL